MCLEGACGSARADGDEVDRAILLDLDRSALADVDSCDHDLDAQGAHTPKSGEMPVDCVDGVRRRGDSGSSREGCIEGDDVVASAYVRDLKAGADGDAAEMVE